MSQVSLWDKIIPAKVDAKFLIHTNKYRFIDQASASQKLNANLMYCIKVYYSV
jgi:hypothetical protein